MQRKSLLSQKPWRTLQVRKRKKESGCLVKARRGSSIKVLWSGFGMVHKIYCRSFRLCALSGQQRIGLSRFCSNMFFRAHLSVVPISERTCTLCRLYKRYLGKRYPAHTRFHHTQAYQSFYVKARKVALRCMWSPGVQCWANWLSVWERSSIEISAMPKHELTFQSRSANCCCMA